MATFFHLLEKHEAILLFLVLGLGLLLSRVQVSGTRVGVAGVLFAGLFWGALGAAQGMRLHIASEVKELGLTLFVYVVGLASGPGFFRTFRSRGVNANLAVLGVLALCAVGLVVAGRMLGLRYGLLAGVFAGALTNTPALGAATQALRGSPYAMDPVLGYSVAYPFGITLGLIVIRSFAGRQASAFRQERERAAPPSLATISTGSCFVLREEVKGHALGELQLRTKMGVVVSRVLRAGEVFVPNKYTVLQEGDILTLVGSAHAVREAIGLIGEISTVQPHVEREKIDTRRILVSRKELAGKSVAALGLERKFGAQLTRVRRADLDIVPSDEFQIELGDRLRVVAPRARLAELTHFFGDSERKLAEVDFLGLALGIAAGLVLGAIEVPVGSAHISLGAAGGPLVVALILGRIGRIGQLSFPLPYETSQSLKEWGLLLFLAGVGVTAGGALEQVMNRQGLVLLGLGAALTTFAAALLLWILRRLLHSDVASCLGTTAGLQTQPATLAAAHEAAERSEEVLVSYAVVYPAAMIGKIVIAQLIATLT